MASPAWRARADGVELFVRLTPRAARDAMEGVKEPGDGTAHWLARVRAVPEKGAANAALERLVAGWLDVPAGSVSVVAGQTARLKTVRVAGDPATLSQRLAGLAGQG